MRTKEEIWFSLSDDQTKKNKTSLIFIDLFFSLCVFDLQVSFRVSNAMACLSIPKRFIVALLTSLGLLILTVIQTNFAITNALILHPNDSNEKVRWTIEDDQENLFSLFSSVEFIGLQLNWVI